MSKSPAFQFYAADYLADENVALMTLEEEGAYIRALAYCWREGSLPADDGRLSRLLKNCSLEALTNVKGCFTVSPNDASRLVHARLDAERKKQEEWKLKSSEAGIKSGKARRAKKFSTEPTLNQPSTGPVEPNMNSSSSFSSSNKKQATCVFPEWLPMDAWNAFVEMRKTERHPLTEAGVKLAISKLEKYHVDGHNIRAILEDSTLKNYRGLFPVENNGNGKPAASNPIDKMRFVNTGGAR